MSCADYSLDPGPDDAGQESGTATNENGEQWWLWRPPCSPRHSAPLALAQPKAKVPAEQVNLTMSRVCPLATRHRRKMLWLTLGSGSWRAFVLLMLLQKSALIFQTTLEAVWCFGTPTAEQRLLHPVLNQRVHYTGKILFCINNLLEPSHVSLQSVSGTETCRVPPHGKIT